MDNIVLRKAFEELKPYLLSQGILVMDYNWSELKIKYPRATEIYETFREYRGKAPDIPGLNQDEEPMTSEWLELIQRLEVAYQTTEIIEILEAISKTYVNMILLYFKEVQKYTDEALRIMKDRIIERIEEEYIPAMLESSKQYGK
jgi:hypothetical protein